MSSDSTSEAGSGSRWSTPPADVDEFRDRLDQAGLSSYSDDLARWIRDSVRLVPDPAADTTRIGTTRLGGEPDLPAGTDWPEGPDVPLSFVGQINLGDVTPLVPNEGLPTAGLLSFFYDTVAMPWGFDPADRGSWAVIYSPADDKLVRHPAPAALSATERFQAVVLNPLRELSFPAAESYDVRELWIEAPDLWLAYSEALGSSEDEEEDTTNRLLGNPDLVQGDMQRECQLASNGIYCGDSRHLDDPRAQTLIKHSSRWRLLLQVDSVDEAGMMWGDVGRIYFWLTDEALRGHRWDETWLVLQCY